MAKTSMIEIMCAHLYYVGHLVIMLSRKRYAF